MQCPARRRGSPGGRRRGKVEGRRVGRCRWRVLELLVVAAKVMEGMPATRVLNPLCPDGVAGLAASEAVATRSVWGCLVPYVIDVLLAEKVIAEVALEFAAKVALREVAGTLADHVPLEAKTWDREEPLEVFRAVVPCGGPVCAIVPVVLGMHDDPPIPRTAGHD